MPFSLFKLARSGTREGVSCDAGGAFIGSVALLKRLHADRADAWVPRDTTAISRDLSRSIGLPIDVSTKAPALKAIAAALNTDDIARAQMLALFLRFPDIAPLTKAKPDRTELFKFVNQLIEGGFIEADRASDDLAKFNPNHWPAGTPDSQGGRFAPDDAGGGGGEDSQTSRQTASEAATVLSSGASTRADAESPAGNPSSSSDNGNTASARDQNPMPANVTPGGASNDVPAAAAQPANALTIDQVQATRYGTTTIKFTQGLTDNQLNAFLVGKVAADAVVTSSRGGAITSNEGASRANRLVHPDHGGSDVEANAQLGDFVKSVASALYNYEPNGDREAEKFVTIGTDASGRYVVTSLQILGDQGSAGVPIPAGTIAIAHTHGAAREYQQPDNADDDWINQTNLPSFVIAGRNGSNIFEIGRNNGTVSVRIIASLLNPDTAGPWEPYHKSPGDYRTYNFRLYPPHP